MAHRGLSLIALLAWLVGEILFQSHMTYWDISTSKLPSDTIFSVYSVLQLHYVFRSTRPSSGATVQFTCFPSVMLFPPYWTVFTILGM
jgi:hypothetical protein